MRHKFHANCAYGGLALAHAEAMATTLQGLFERPLITAATLQA